MQELHQQFDLPEDWPYFRRVSAYRFPNETYKDGYLRNPHRVLTHPSLDQGKVQQIAHLVIHKYIKHVLFEGLINCFAMCVNQGELGSRNLQLPPLHAGPH